LQSDEFLDLLDLFLREVSNYGLNKKCGRIVAPFQRMCKNYSLNIDRSSLNGNYSLKRVCNFLVCERQILKRMDAVIERDVCLEV